jgi:hypothetical protein
MQASSLHVYQSRDQPATRYSVPLDTPKGRKTIWSTNRRRTTLVCFTCRQRRWAGNLTAHVYYDGVYYFCKPGKGHHPRKES